jgi:hypothetical protein
VIWHHTALSGCEHNAQGTPWTKRRLLRCHVRMHATNPQRCARAHSTFAQHMSWGLILSPTTNAPGMHASNCQHIKSLRGFAGEALPATVRSSWASRFCRLGALYFSSRLGLLVPSLSLVVRLSRFLLCYAEMLALLFPCAPRVFRS